MLTYTDRSRQEDGLAWCLRRRWHRYHGGSNGYGIIGVARNIPLLTGQGAHSALAGVLRTLAVGSAAPTFPLNEHARAQVRAAIRSAQDEYRAEVERAKKRLQSVNEDAVERTVNEQCALVEGITWNWTRQQLPILLAEHEIVAVEEEEWFVIGCDCPAGRKRANKTLVKKKMKKEELADHQKADCNGLVHQARPDFVTRRRSDNQFGVDDFKTSSYDVGEDEVELYRTSPQQATQTLAVERRIGEKVSHYTLHVLHKGGRRRMYSGPNEYKGPYQQQVHYCYVGFEPGVTEDKFSTKSGQGGVPWYKKTSTWEINPERPKGWTPVEYVVENVMSEAERNALLTRLGPYDRQTWMIPGHLRSVEAEELVRWPRRNWDVYNDATGHPDRQGNATRRAIPLKDALDEHIPQSWQCKKWGRMCSYLPICTGEIPTTIEAIMESGLYQLRVPHHEPELQALKKAGVPLPKEMLADSEEAGE
jgi:hypothetical protein